MLNGFERWRYRGAFMVPFSATTADAFPLDTRVLPLIAVGIAVFVQVVRAVYNHGKRIPINQSQCETGNAISPSAPSRLQRWIKGHGGGTIVGFRILRLLGSAVLVGLSVASAVPCIMLDQVSGWPIAKPLERCPESFMTITYLYASILAFLSLVMASYTILAARLNTLVLLVSLGVYLHRNIWPLATYTLKPIDEAEGALLWVKLGVLTVVAVCIPLFIPTQYVPVDPKNPMPVPNPGQTCSVFSKLTFSYLDPIIWLGYRVPHLAHDKLPPMADYEEAHYLRSKGFPHIDYFHGGKRQHLFFGMMRAFRREYIIMATAIVTQVFFSFASPIGINRILAYLETGGKNASVRPWFWIVWLFMGPMAQSLFFQIYLLLLTVIMVRSESLITELVFEHSLRIRLKAETNDEPSTSVGSETSSIISAAASEGTSEDGEHESRNENGSESSHGSTAVASREASSSRTLAPTSSTQSKGKAAATVKPEKENTNNKKDAENLIGKINNLVTTDLNNLLDGMDFLTIGLSVPLQITLCMVFLYQVLGWSAFVGLAITIALLPAPGYVTKLSRDVQVEKMKMTDARVQAVTESINVLRMVKLFGWEKQMSDRLQEKRERELSWLLKIKLYGLANAVFSSFIPTFTMLGTYSTYTAIMKEELTASKIFSSMAVFSMMSDQLHRVAWQLTMLIQGKVSLDRISEFVRKTELLDVFAASAEPFNKQPIPVSALEDSSEIGFRNATFSWSAEEQDGTLTPRSRSYRLRITGDLFFKKNAINLIIGPTGSGKTSMLMALLGEMHFIASQPDSCYNLPREGGIAYAAQESWVQNQTIRENILFGSPYDEQRYRKVILQCALERDMELFEAGDQTEVGERGLTLSGGQKARITLARAIYSSAKTILLDDILAALDVHTSAWIIDHCLRGDLVKGRTVLLVTHNVALASPIAEFIVSLGVDGTVKSQGTEIAHALAKDPALSSEVKHDQEANTVEKQDIHETEGTKKADGKLVIAEEIAEGHVTWKSMTLLFKALGGKRPILFFLLWVSGLFLSEWATAYQTWFLGHWGSQYETHHPSEVPISYYLSIYTCILVATLVIYCSSYLVYTLGIVRASRSIHNQLMDSVFGSTLRWLDETPTARIIARFTQDVRSVDGPVSQNLIWVSELTIGMLTRLGVVVLFTPAFLVPGVSAAAMGLFLGNMYLKAQLSVKREMSNARSPLLAHFSAAIHGIVSIRAYNAQEIFKEESLKRLNHYTKVAHSSWSLNRWIAIRIDFLGAIFTAGLASYLVYRRSISSANTGFSLNMAVGLCTCILWLVRLYNDFEVQSNSLERIQGYIDIDHEPKPTESGKPPAAWPTSGDLRVENLCARYSKTGPEVLHNLNFHIKSGERIGIVGRTGSGKSSLTLALLRCILTEGTVYYDGLPTRDMNLDALRSSITIIPQTPELLSGTLRENLDPFESSDDATLNGALRAAGLFSLQEDMEEGRITLDSKIAGGGGNLSVGQRQIIALARAMVRGSKLLILDEATSAIDYKTDAVIQSTLRRQLPSDVTVITVAHRLQTIMDADKIMVLDSGNIVEFGSPNSLLKNSKGMLRSLVDGSGDSATLIAMAEGQSLQQPLNV